jgi:hypothetical protein
MFQPLDCYKVYVGEAIVAEVPLIIPNMDDYPPWFRVLIDNVVV